MNNKHKYLIFSEKPIVGSISEAASLITNFYLKEKNYSIKKWRKEKNRFRIEWEEGDQKLYSEPINYLEIARYIREKGFFDNQAYNLPKMECFWLDFSLNYKINWHFFDNPESGGLFTLDATPQQQYGPDFPIKPKLNREGHSFTSFQPQLLYHIFQKRTELVEKSEDALEDSWFFNLRNLINDTISLVDITLNQIYNKAEFDPLPGWAFDKEKLGEKYGRRFGDKLGWIFKVSGKHLEIEKYIESILILKAVRNHLTHFDPPTFVVSIEEAASWLNQIKDVGWLLIKIRQAIGAEISLSLVNFILQKAVMFNPENAFAKRFPLDSKGGGYYSSTWNSDGL